MTRILDLPPDEELTKELIDELFEEAEREYFAESGSPRRWKELLVEVVTAAGGRFLDPTAPLQQIGGFEAEGVLGAGSYGCVFKVRDLKLDRLVALKLCIVRGPESAKALMAEARTLARLSHPNIVTVHETGDHEGDFFFVMQYVDGPTLSRYLFDERIADPPAWTELVDIFCVVGEALAAAHEAGVAHGDLKPSNILIERETLTPYVADFGLSRVLESTEDEEAMMGTLPFMAPEVLRGELADARSDQYSFCVSLWQCLDEGRTPYWGEDAEMLLMDIGFGRPPFVNPDVPERVLNILRKGLDAEPAERYPDMRALVRELQIARGPRLVELAPAPEPEPEPPAGGGRGAIVALAFFVAVGLVLYLLRAQSVEAPPEPSAAATSPCGASPWEPTPVIESVCTLIRADQLEGAKQLWDSEYEGLEAQSYRQMLARARATLIIAQVLTDQGESDLARIRAKQAHRDWKDARQLYAQPVAGNAEFLEVLAEIDRQIGPLEAEERTLLNPEQE